MGRPELMGLRRSLPLVKQLLKSSSATEAEASCLAEWRQLEWFRCRNGWSAVWRTAWSLTGAAAPALVSAAC